MPSCSMFQTAQCLMRSIRTSLLLFNPNLVEGCSDITESYNISTTSQRGGFV